MSNLAMKLIAPLFLAGVVFAADPSSTNYTLKGYDLGGSGGSGSSTNFKLNANVGGTTGADQSGSGGTLGTGSTTTTEANVPPAPTFTNPSSEYKRLRLTLNTGNNPTDTKYNIAISLDNFVTTLYVQTDNTIGPGLTIANYQTYTSWGGASGFWITGLLPNTTYKVKVRALQGDFTGTPYGPEASAATVMPSLTFGVATTLTATPPFVMSFSGLTAGTVFDANADALLTVTTNALFGGSIYVKDLNAGLTSAAASTTISSSTANLTAAATGYGGIITAVSQSAGGPVTSAAPFNGVSNNVGGLTASLQTLSSTSSPVTNGSTTFRLKAKVNAITPAATDYADTLTFIAAMMY